jgi:hypothetical protein
MVLVSRGDGKSARTKSGVAIKIKKWEGETLPKKYVFQGRTPRGMQAPHGNPKIIRIKKSTKNTKCAGGNWPGGVTEVLDSSSEHSKRHPSDKLPESVGPRCVSSSALALLLAA